MDAEKSETQCIFARQTQHITLVYRYVQTAERAHRFRFLNAQVSKKIAELKQSSMVRNIF